ncbi:MAG: hypothetical protein U0235_28040 [Polyangiaceae bacterium]
MNGSAGRRDGSARNQAVGAILIAGNVITPEQCEWLVRDAALTNERIEDTIIYRGLASEVDLLKFLASHHRTRFVSTERLSKADIDRTTLAMIPRQVAETFAIFPVMFDPAQGALSVVTADPDDGPLLKGNSKRHGGPRGEGRLPRPAAVHHHRALLRGRSRVRAPHSGNARRGWTVAGACTASRCVKARGPPKGPGREDVVVLELDDKPIGTQVTAPARAAQPAPTGQPAATRSAPAAPLTPAARNVLASRRLAIDDAARGSSGAADAGRLARVPRQAVAAPAPPLRPQHRGRERRHRHDCSTPMVAPKPPVATPPERQFPSGTTAMAQATVATASAARSTGVRLPAPSTPEVRSVTSIPPPSGRATLPPGFVGAPPPRVDPRGGGRARQRARRAPRLVAPRSPRALFARRRASCAASAPATQSSARASRDAHARGPAP